MMFSAFVKWQSIPAKTFWNCRRNDGRTDNTRLGVLCYVHNVGQIAGLKQNKIAICCLKLNSAVVCADNILVMRRIIDERIKHEIFKANNFFYNNMLNFKCFYLYTRHQ